MLLSFIMPICQALPNRTTWHLNATDYLQEIGVVNLRLKTRLAQEYIQRRLKKVFLTFTKNIKTYLQKIDNHYE